MKKKILLGVWFTFLIAAISYLFWQNEFKYSLPTPVPQNYNDIAMGSKIDLKCCITDQRPVFIHFFNPECPCSRFNVPHVSSLIKEYGDRINFKIVVLNKEKTFSYRSIKNWVNKLIKEIPEDVWWVEFIPSL